MSFRNFKEILIAFVQAFCIAGITIFAVVPVSCKVSTEGIQIVGGDYTSPVMEELKVVDENSVLISFSKKVRITEAVVSPFMEGLSDSASHSLTQEPSSAIKAALGDYGKIPVTTENLENDSAVLFKFNTPTAVGKPYELYAVVEDETGNSLTFAVSFTGFNPCIPSVLITEAQIKYAKATLKTGPEFRSEYVEILALEDGNLAGLRLVSASDGEAKAYNFPGIEVHRGEIIVVHLRNAGEGCVSELEDNLNLATGCYSATDVRDLWDSENSSHFNDSDDVIFIEDKATGRIIDGMMYSNGNSEEWKEKIAPYAKRLYENGLFDTDDISGAIINSGTTPKKSITRTCAKELFDRLEAGVEIEFPICSNSDEWEVCAVSPGIL